MSDRGDRGDRGDIVDVQTNEERAEALKAWGWVSYVLHLIVAVGALIPGAQPGAALLAIALVIDLVKKKRCRGHVASQPFFVPDSHRAVGGLAVFTDRAAVVVVYFSRLDRLGRNFDLVFVPHRARHGGYEPQRGTVGLTLFCQYFTFFSTRYA